MLFDKDGNRKYMVEPEWRAFLAAADRADTLTRAFCWTLMRTGARLTEVRNLTAKSFDAATCCVVIRCLKRRKIVYRDVPIQRELFQLVEASFDFAARRADPVRLNQKLWPWCRTTAWSCERMKSGVVRRSGASARASDIETPEAILIAVFAASDDLSELEA